MNTRDSNLPVDMVDPDPTPLTADGATLALIDAIRALDHKVDNMQRVQVRIETRLVRLIRHLGAQDDINTKQKGNIS